MKKLIAFILILTLAVPAAALADLPDISGLSEEELIELNHQIQMRLFNEKLINGVDVPAGEYTVGTDLPEGTYRMVIVFPSAGGHMSVFKSEEQKSAIDESFLGEYWGVTEIGKITLVDGNILRISGNTLRLFAYTGLFN